MGTEIYNHPQPYHPPFFRSMDGGVTWQDVTGTLPWHVVAIQAHPTNSTVYALTEGAGLFATTDAGDNWQRMATPYPEVSLLIDPLTPSRLFGGVVSAQSWPGGAYASSDGGHSFHPIGLSGITVGGMSLSQQGRVLLASGYQSGIWRAVVPTIP